MFISTVQSSRIREKSIKERIYLPGCGASSRKASTGATRLSHNKGENLYVRSFRSKSLYTTLNHGINKLPGRASQPGDLPSARNDFYEAIPAERRRAAPRARCQCTEISRLALVKVNLSRGRALPCERTHADNRAT